MLQTSRCKRKRRPRPGCRNVYAVSIAVDGTKVVIEIHKNLATVTAAPRRRADSILVKTPSEMQVIYV